MKQRIKREKLMAEINITPFTDVVLVLLIIFMITTPMLVQPGIKVKLPKAAAADTENDKPLEILIDSKGDVFLANKRLDGGVADLKEKLTARLYNKPDTPVVVKGDKDVRYDVVIQVIDAAKQAGAKKFALAVELQNENASK
jgi:biopolymer transport protein ExbD